MLAVAILCALFMVAIADALEPTRPATDAWNLIEAAEEHSVWVFDSPGASQRGTPSADTLHLHRQGKA
jgi:hypothetical protein